MKTLPLAFAAGLLSACASIGTYDVDDGGYARRGVEEAPVANASSHETPLAQPTIRLADGKLRPRRDAAADVAEKLCDADGWASLTGAARADIPVDRLPKPHRIVGPDDLITQDFLPERLNIYLDRNGAVYRVACG